MAILAIITVICNLINKCTKFSSHIYVSNIYFNEKFVQNVEVDANIGINNKMLVLLINRLSIFSFFAYHRWMIMYHWMWRWGMSTTRCTRGQSYAPTVTI
jgi:hypothetical protein